MSTPAWTPCPCCPEWWCTVHTCHTGDVACTCPAIEDWTVDPYTEGGPVPGSGGEPPTGSPRGPILAP